MLENISGKHNPLKREYVSAGIASEATLSKQVASRL